MDIAALSMSISQMKVAQQAGISVMKMAMDAGQTQMNDIVQMVQQNTKMMEQSITPHLGKNIDISL
ncbi:Putative motility protein [Geosporobacter subterraneus DSM 17957]|uniref:Putative motility protein n=1 Tax=Geosporobacter subterraneus DSM 17957 TaxID=1121919 RepID=A0A1M6CMP0_9FIRM|nr:YjfB family protein [Geosporobacter subterraneus]SHI62266.1 Putative motility protein [Geosporobacter subterraneus DSM 17957]